MSGRSLIVNADDFNSDAERSRGILEARTEGIVSSTTVLTNLPLSDQTIAELRKAFGPAIGVHLNLTKGHPLTSGRSLVDGTGLFFDKQDAWQRALQKGYDLDKVFDEFSAQVEQLIDNGIRPSHLDGNNHLHIFPGIAGVVAKVAVRYDIRQLRLPLETLSEPGWIWPGKRYFINRLSRRAERIFSRSGLSFTDHFRGIHFPRPGQTEDLVHLIESLPRGVTELMCHPGYTDADSGEFSNSEREAELAELTAPEVIEVIEENDIRLISYADLPLG